MSRTSNPRPADERRALRAMGNHCNGSISAGESNWLAEQLRHDSVMQALYVDYMSMHACLSSEVAALQPVPIDAPAHELTTLTSESYFARVSSRIGSSWLTLAATLIFVALFTALGYALLWRDGRAVANLDQGAPIARITGTQNCRWGDSGIEIGYGSTIGPGQTIRLDEGLAEITFEDGATMLLESPATVVFQADDQVEIREGRLAAIVPPGADSFCIRTQTLNLCNADAEFGLLARDSGASELHVFNGTVEANFLGAAGQRQRQMQVRASEAVLASPTTTTVVEFAANETHFVRSLSAVPGPQDGLLAYEGFVYPDGPLSEQNGGFGWAGPWSTIAADTQAGPESNSVISGSLATNGFVPRGNHAAIVAQGNRIRRALASSVGGMFDAAGLMENRNGVRLIGRDGTKVYLSFLQRVDKADDGFYGLELHRGDGNANRVLCIGNGADETDYGVTSTVNVYGAQNFPALGTENTEVNFFVVKVSFGALDRDTVEVFRNPASLTDEQRCHADAVLTGNFAFDRISLANFDGSKIHEVDELRVGTHFLAVTGRWGGERSRLLRQLTERNSTSGERRIAIRSAAQRRISRNLLLAAVIAD
ncbi:MAG: hypothetical protein ACR2NM_16645 [Bythopirellula sp.]